MQRAWLILPAFSLGACLFDVADVAARYVRIVGRGNSENLWHSLTEVDLVGRNAPPIVAALDTSIARSKPSLR